MVSCEKVLGNSRRQWFFSGSDCADEVCVWTSLDSEEHTLCSSRLGYERKVEGEREEDDCATEHNCIACRILGSVPVAATSRRVHFADSFCGPIIRAPDPNGPMGAPFASFWPMSAAQGEIFQGSTAMPGAVADVMNLASTAVRTSVASLRVATHEQVLPNEVSKFP